MAGRGDPREADALAADRPEPETRGARPPGGPRPPAPPATGEPGGLPDPADPGPPIVVRLNEKPFGDLGNRRVDASLLVAILRRGSAVAAWLQDHDVRSVLVDAAFPGSNSPLLAAGRDATSVRLDRMPLGNLGEPTADARLLWAILRRDRPVAAWLRSQAIDTATLENAFPGSAWR